MITRVGVLFVAFVVGSMAKDKVAPTAEGGNAAVSITATAYTDPAEVQALLGSEFGGYYTVLQVTVTPKAGVLTIDRDDFMLRTDKDGERTHPMAPNQIAGRSDMVLHSIRVAPKGPSSDNTGNIWGGATAVGNKPTSAAATTATVNTDLKAKADPLLPALRDKILAEKETEQPLSGLLVFSLEKQKAKDLELIYTTAEGPLKLRFR